MRGLTRRKPTPEAVDEIVRRSFFDSLSWKASRIILVRVTNDPAFVALEPELKASILRFLARHPGPDDIRPAGGG